MRRRRPSAALVIAILALIVALGGTGLAAGGAFNRAETRAVKKISKQETKKRVVKIFRTLPDTQGSGVRIFRTNAFQLRVVCAPDGVGVYMYANGDAVSINGASDIQTVKGDTDLRLAYAHHADQGNRVTSFAIATKGGKVWSGNLAFDYPDGGIFEGVPDRCVAYGHIMVD